MKTTNLTRKEAVLACLDGKKVGNSSIASDDYYFYDSYGFSLYEKSGRRYSSAGFTSKDGYFIYEPEPTFKEVTMYAHVYKNAQGKEFVSEILFDSLLEAVKCKGAIGYTEVKVYLKESEGEDE